jgi:hypothetical protein
MKLTARQEAQLLAMDYGIHLPQVIDYLNREQYGNAYSLAADAQPTLITTSNGGIPAFLANYLDPKLIEVLVSPMKAALIIGEAKKGDWTTLTAQFPIVESTGETSAYGDYSNNGQSSANVNWEPRQSYHFQTITNWGERELEIAGEARIDWASRLSIASALTLAKTHNKMAFFGIANLQNYGLLNDPSLPTPISPAATGTGSSVLWSTKDSGAIYGDIQQLFRQLVSQSHGLIDKDQELVLAMSNDMATNLTKTNQYNVNVEDQLKKNFPKLRVETAVEYTTTGGELIQLICVNLEGQKTAEVAFTEKMRAHPVKVGLSSFRQKKSGGGWGTIVYRPFCIAGMLGS